MQEPPEERTAQTAEAEEGREVVPLLAQGAGAHAPVQDVRSRGFYVLVREEVPPPVVGEGALLSCETGAPVSRVVGRIVDHREGRLGKDPASRPEVQAEDTATAREERSEGKERCNETTRLTIAAEGRRRQVGDIQVVGDMVDEPRCTEPTAADERRVAEAGGGRQAVGVEEGSVQERARSSVCIARSRTGVQWGMRTDTAAHEVPLAVDTYNDLRTPSEGADVSSWAWVACGAASQDPWRLQARGRGQEKYTML